MSKPKKRTRNAAETRHRVAALIRRMEMGARRTASASDALKSGAEGEEDEEKATAMRDQAREYRGAAVAYAHSANLVRQAIKAQR